MSRLLTPVLALAFTLTLVACSKDPGQAEPSAAAGQHGATLGLSGAPSGLTVGGESVPQALIDTYAARRGYDLKDPGQVKQAREQVGTLVALAQHAVRSGALSKPELELDRLDLLSGYTIGTGLQALPPLDDAALKARYDAEIAKIGTLEYRIRHLLFRNGALAEEAAQQVAAGRPFADVLAAYQNNPEVPEARELPWIHLGKIPPQDTALAQAIRDTPVGQASTQVIITPSGWHLIEVLETRALTPPDFESLKGNIRQTEERARREQLIESIRSAAQIEGLAP